LRAVSREGLVDLTIIAEELGRMVHPGPFQATNIVASAVANAGSPAQQERFLPGIAGGEIIATWAYGEPDAEWPASSVRLAARPSGSGFVLDGVKTYVHDAKAAALLLVSAVAPQGLTQFLVASDTPGITIEPLESLDLARRLATVRFSSVELTADALLGEPGSAGSAIEHQLQVALALQCAETNGATGQGFEMTVQYAKDRVAFGRPIGSYQALKHRMADHRMRLEGSYASAAYAAKAIQQGRADAAIAARVAKAHVGKWSSSILHDCIQLHGGIGMTFEYDLHLYFRRAISNEVLYGSPYEHQRGLVDLVEGAA
jgi:alkylation response protein AidB-like acyl-CoA dehydrogenase